MGSSIGLRGEGIAADPEAARIHQFADLAFAQALVGFQVNRAVALLESDGDVLLGIGFAGGGDDRLYAVEVHAHGLFAIDVLARLDGGGQHARMLEGRRGDDDGVEIGGGQQLFVILVDGGLFDLDFLGADFDAIVEQIAERGHARARVGIEDGGIVLAAAADADQSDGDFGIGLRAADGLRAHDGEAGGNRRAGLFDELPPGKAGVGFGHGE